ncbi:MAG: TetR/AcrR family transcriptional regulator [Acidimicrobiales bacterium]
MAGTGVLTRDPAPAAPGLEGRILAAGLACIARWGVAKTSLDDVARQAGCSRATVYRLFPGGKEALVGAVARAEVAKVAAAVVAAGEGAPTIEELLAATLAEAWRQVHCHPAVASLQVHEPETIVPWLAFAGKEALLAFATDLLAPSLGRWLPVSEARRTAEWAARVWHSFTVFPSRGVDLGDDHSARCFVTTFMLPGLKEAP